MADAGRRAVPSPDLPILPSIAAELPIADVLQALGTNPALGLTSGETSRRLERFGRNELQPRGLAGPKRETTIAPRVRAVKGA